MLTNNQKNTFHVFREILEKFQRLTRTQEVSEREQTLKFGGKGIDNRKLENPPDGLHEISWKTRDFSLEL